MLDTLNPLIKRTRTKRDIAFGTPPEKWQTSIDSLREQMFHHKPDVGFEEFMSMLWSAKYMARYLDLDKNIFRQEEREIRTALKTYLSDCVRRVDWHSQGGQAILRFVRSIDWSRDFVITFNYDLLLETAAEREGLAVDGRVVHLHGTVNDEQLAWPIYAKFAYLTTKKALGPHWKQAFRILRSQADAGIMERLVFIGYSMPRSDLEAHNLFNYTDWYNVDSRYKYSVVVVNPGDVQAQYSYLRKPVEFRRETLADWVSPHAAQPTL
jgi:hypothetical protein